MSVRSTARMACLVILCATTAAAGLPGPTFADWEVESVPSAPNAAAVILERIGEMRIEQDSTSSYLEVYVKLKVLTAEGTDYGTISLFSSDFYRTKEIEGRTHLPGGGVLELSTDVTFEKQYSDDYDTTVRSAALPGVVPGAIVEYRYRTYFDSIYHPASWYFQDEIPTLLSRITFYLPQGISFGPVVNKTLPNLELEEESSSTAKGNKATYTMRNLPPVPDEPDRFPFADLACRVKMVPIKSYLGSVPWPLYESWLSVMELAVGNDEYGYTHFFRNRRSARSRARELAASGSGPRGTAEALYRWVRDEVEDTDDDDIWVGLQTADSVLAERKGDTAGQALLLYSMLDAVKIPARVAWTTPRHHGRIQPKVSDPSQLETVLVVVELDGERLYLDPSDTSAGFGVLRPSLQGVPVLIVDLDKPKASEWAVTPQLPAEASARTARIDLTLGEDGALAGSGRLELTGNHAWARLKWRDTAEKTREAWTKWLEGRFPELTVGDLEVTEDVEARTVTVAWTVGQRADEVLGDETTITPARPFVVTANPYSLPPQQRLTPLQLAYPDLDRVETTLSWPEGWVVDAAPEGRTKTTGAGRLESTVSLDEASRRATFSRTFVISSQQFAGGAAYADLRALYEAAVAADARQLSLIAE